MKKLNCIILIFSIFIIPLLGPFVINAETISSNELKKNVNEIDDLSKITVSKFKWKQKTKGIPGIFDYVEISNKTKINIKNIRLEVLMYDSKGILYKFLIPINGKISSNSTKRFSSILTPILNFFPEQTIVNIESAKLLHFTEQEFSKALDITSNEGL